MSKQPHITFEHALYIAIFFIALALRLGHLGNSPLNEIEAEQALIAYQLSEGEAVDLGSQPTYVLLTGLTFSFLSSSDFLARIWPALFGSGLVLTPFCFRKSLGRKAALLLALGLAIAPGFVAASRLASGAMLSVSLLVFTSLAWINGRVRLSGFLAALTLLSGPNLYVGLLSMIFAWLLITFVARRAQLDNGTIQPGTGIKVREGMRSAFLSFSLTLVLGTTVLLQVPQAFSGAGSSLANYLASWLEPAKMPIEQLLLALLGYSLPVVIFGLAGVARAWLQEVALDRSLSLWALAAFVVVSVYPGRQILDLLWVLLPLWALAAREISRFLRFPRDNAATVLWLAVLVLLLLAFLLLDVAGLASLDPGSEAWRNRLFLAGGVILLAAVAVALIGFGWSSEVASLGLVWALCLASVMGLLSATWRIAAGGSANELWGPGSAAGETELLVESLASLSEWQTGRSDQLGVVVQSDSFVLQWVLRAWPELRFAQVLDASDQPPVILTNGFEDQPSQFSAYRGQSFLWSVDRDWRSKWPPNIFAWLIFRDAATRSKQLVLWARTDLFPATQGTEAQIINQDAAGIFEK